MEKLKVVESATKPGPEYVEVTPDLVHRWEKLLTDMENQVNEIESILKQAGIEPKYKVNK